MELSDRDFQKLASFVYSYCGIYLHEGKKEMVKARLGKQMRLKGFTNFKDYFHDVKQDETGNEIIALINAISTNLTSFFREPKHFDFLIEKIIPDINRQGYSRLRAWSAGCSTGEEPYTLAMVFLENLSSPIRDFKILASDISTQVLQRAIRGEYTEDRILTIPKPLIKRYFTKATNKGQSVYKVKDALKNRIRFARLNLMKSFPLKGPFQVIFCRNVMIYFDHPSREKLVEKFYQLLERGGYFFVGHSESLTGISHPFKYVAPSIYRK